jgi:hypothetical protein
MDTYNVNLGGDYLTFSRVQDGEEKSKPARSRKPETAPPKKTPPERPAVAGLRRFMDRRREFMKLVCSLPEREYLFLTLVPDKARNPEAIADPTIWQAWLNRFRSAFTYHLPKGFYLWKAELDSDGKGIHFHLIVTTGDDIDKERFKAWANQAWGRIVKSDWGRLVDVQEMTPARIGYFFKVRKNAHSLELERMLGKNFSFGLIGRKNCALKPVNHYLVSAATIERIREHLIKHTIVQSKYRPGGKVNTAHVFSIKSDFCFHAFLGALRPTIETILEASQHDSSESSSRLWPEVGAVRSGGAIQRC